jgi:catechol 2,3-dioxygenase-like lactoylglutathione lyase family enzyme
VTLDRAAVHAFVATTNPAGALSFYRDRLGLRLIADERFAIVFASGDTELRVQKVRELTPHAFTALGWLVDDIRAAVRELAGRGVTFDRLSMPQFPQDELGIWTADDGTRVAWLRDPDGNILSLTQHRARA